MARIALALVLLTTCTAPAPEPPEAGPRSGPAPSEDGSAGPGPIRIPVAATGEDGGRLEGMRLALEEVNEAGGVHGRPLALEPVAALPDALRARGPAVLFVGPGSAVEEQRAAIEEGGRPVFLLGGDLYSSRSLFRQVFQVSPPVLWEARVLGRYAARDRRHARVALLHGSGIDGERAREAALEAFARQGLDLDPVVAHDEDASIVAALRGPDALVVAGARSLAAAASRAAEGLEDPPQLLLVGAGLAAHSDPPPPPGTVAVGPYTWASWAEPIPRVRRFRSRFERAAGRLPSAAEQEGYDVIRALADALEETGGGGGPRLIRALESFHRRAPAYSSLPVALSPDDHLFPNELQLGLFAVTGPHRDTDPWVEGLPWRPLIRTFTYDGRRTLFLERDRRVFFPFWREGRPSPAFPRSRYGIVTRAVEDPLH